MDYESMSVSELKELAKEKGIKGITALKKADIVERLKQNDAEKAKHEKSEKADKQTKTVNTVVKEEASEKPAERRKMPEKPLEQRRMRPAPQQQQPRRQMLERPSEQRQMLERPSEQRQMPERPMEQRRVQEKPAEPAPQQLQPQQQPQQPKQAEYVFDPRSQAGTELDSGIEKYGILEIMSDGFGFIRCDNFLPGNNDVYVSPMQIKRYGLRSGDIIRGNTKVQAPNEKFSALLYIKDVNGYSLEDTIKRKKFETLTPIFPKDRIHTETPSSSVAMRMVDLIAPIGKGQRGMIVSQPKSGKTTLLKEVANSITRNHPDMHLIILLIDERPEEVTDMKESIKGDKVEVIYSTFDELPENHKRVSEMVIERAKRLVEHGEDVVILLDSITRLARAYNLTVTSSGRTLSGGLDPAALHMPKKFFGAARTMREGGSLTILATALVDTGSRMDDVVFEEFKGTGNMELVLDRNLSERRIFPAIDLAKSGTRRDDLLLNKDEYEAMARVRRALNGAHPEDATERLINMCAHTRNNVEFVQTILKGFNA